MSQADGDSTLAAPMAAQSLRDTPGAVSLALENVFLAVNTAAATVAAASSAVDAAALASPVAACDSAHAAMDALQRDAAELQALHERVLRARTELAGAVQQLRAQGAPTQKRTSTRRA